MVYFIDWNIITLIGRSVIMTFLFEWMSLLFIGFVFIISSLVILYSDDYMFGDLNIIRFIILVLIFVVSIIFYIILYYITLENNELTLNKCVSKGLINF